MSYIDQIENSGACIEAVDWLREADYPTPQEAWNACSRADWMLWLLRIPGNAHGCVAVACDIAETALIHVPKGEDRPRIAIETARRWLVGEASIEDVSIAADAAYTAIRSAAFTAAAAAYAATAAYAAADTARSAVRSAASAAYVAAAAADAARSAAYDSAAYDSIAADIVRRHFPNPPSLG